VASAPEYRRSADTTSRCLERARSVGAGPLQIADGFLNPAGVSGHPGPAGTVAREPARLPLYEREVV